MRGAEKRQAPVRPRRESDQVDRAGELRPGARHRLCEFVSAFHSSKRWKLNLATNGELTSDERTVDFVQFL